MNINKVNAVVTGGGSGLGEGTAKYLKSKGANVFLIDVNEDNLKNFFRIGCRILLEMFLIQI